LAEFLQQEGRRPNVTSLWSKWADS